MKLVIAEPTDVVRLGLVAALESHEDMQVVDAVADAQSLWDALDKVETDVVLVDLAVAPQDHKGPKYIGEIVQTGLPVIALADEISDADMLQVFRSGARGLVLVATAPTVLPPAVQSVASGGMFIDPQIASNLIMIATKGQPGSHGPFDLTVQQQRVLALLPDGLTNREIGEELGISPNTVKAHLRKAMAKIDANDRTEAAEIVRELAFGPETVNT